MEGGISTAKNKDQGALKLMTIVRRLVYTTEGLDALETGCDRDSERVRMSVSCWRQFLWISPKSADLPVSEVVEMSSHGMVTCSMLPSRER